MDLEFWLPLLIVFISLFTGIAILPLPEKAVAARTALNLLGAVVKVVLVVVMIEGVLRGARFETRLPFVPGMDLVLRTDRISLLFISLSAGLWLLTTIYAIGYLEGGAHLSRFFGFFSLCVTSTMGIALAGNLVTFFVFYELLTLTTYPLIVHRQTPESFAAGRVYLVYTMTSAAVLLAAIAWLHLIAGPVEFTDGGALGDAVARHPRQLQVIFGLLMLGLGVKTALVPLHGWLPRAMVAPAPVSALLHAVAVVKAGAFGIVRVVEDLYGPAGASRLGLLAPLAAAAAVTIVWGSVRALSQADLKRRLAYSTVSQLSYIVLGAAMFGEVATTAALVHIVHQGLMKITLFYCAGILAETLGIHRVDEMRGAGRRMPLTMGAFTIAAFGMIGVPPVAGFISKWYLGLGAYASGQTWAIWVLIASTLLNAAYFLPIVYAAWFQEPDGRWHEHGSRGALEANPTLLIPALATALLSVTSGLFAAADYSPLALARIIARGMYPG